MSTRDEIMRDYVPVNERIGAFLAKHPDGSLQSELVDLSETRVVMRAYAYRTPDDARPGIGYSSLEIPGRTPYTRGSEIENCETSAWGRAIAALGFEVKRGVASAEEVANKAATDTEQARDDTRQTREEEFTADGGLVGTVKVSGKQDGELRQSPEGWTLPFRVGNGNKSYIVHAEDAIAEALAAIKDQVIGKRVTVWGRWSDETIPAKGTKPQINYRILHLERIQTPDVVLPGWEDAEPPLEEPPPEIPLFGEKVAS